MTYKKIPLSKGKVALVDVEDYAELSKYKKKSHNKGHSNLIVKKCKL